MSFEQNPVICPVFPANEWNATGTTDESSEV